MREMRQRFCEFGYAIYFTVKKEKKNTLCRTGVFRDAATEDALRTVKINSKMGRLRANAAAT